jgi:hypothetical protein
MEEKIQVPIGKALLELTERVADNADEKSFYSISNYADALVNALSTGESIEGIKDSALKP